MPDTGCKCPGWINFHCRDGIAWDAEGVRYQSQPPGKHCRCLDECCNTGWYADDGDGYVDFMPENDTCTCAWKDDA